MNKKTIYSLFVLGALTCAPVYGAKISVGPLTLDTTEAACAPAIIDCWNQDKPYIVALVTTSDRHMHLENVEDLAPRLLSTGNTPTVDGIFVVSASLFTIKKPDYADATMHKFNEEDIACADVAFDEAASLRFRSLIFDEVGMSEPGAPLPGSTDSIHEAPDPEMEAIWARREAQLKCAPRVYGKRSDAELSAP